MTEGANHNKVTTKAPRNFYIIIYMITFIKLLKNNENVLGAKFSFAFPNKRK